jgi:hypothetical protein
MTTPRTCDQLGVCQHRAQPCNGCQAAPRRSHRICSADQCQQGRAPCPCPTACELPEHGAQRDDAMTTTKAALIWACVTLNAALLVAVILAGSA